MHSRFARLFLSVSVSSVLSGESAKRFGRKKEEQGNGAKRTLHRSPRPLGGKCKAFSTDRGGRTERWEPCPQGGATRAQFLPMCPPAPIRRKRFALSPEKEEQGNRAPFSPQGGNRAEWTLLRRLTAGAAARPGEPGWPAPAWPARTAPECCSWCKPSSPWPRPRRGRWTRRPGCSRS